MYRRHKIQNLNLNLKCIRTHMCTRHSESHTHCRSSSNLLLHTIPTWNYLWKQALQRQHTHSHTKNSRGPVQIASKCATNALCAKSPNIYCTLIFKTLDGVWVQCFVWQIPKASYFSIQSCAVGDESAQEYTQLNAFLLCVSDFGWQWGQWSRGDNGGCWWQLAKCIQPAQWIPVRFPQVSASSSPEAVQNSRQKQEEDRGDSSRGFLQGGSGGILELVKMWGILCLT